MDKKIALVIGASSEALYAIKKAREYNLYVIAFDQNPKAVALNEADESAVLDISDCNSVISYLGQRTPSLVLPVPIGRCLITSGKINDYYGLQGIGFKACDLCTDKFEFHNTLANEKLRDSECILINNLNYKKPTKFPVVLKPRFGSGSKQVFVLHSQQDLDSTVEDIIPFTEDYICETCVKGNEYGLDAMVLNGKLSIILLRKKELTPEPYRQSLGYYAVNFTDNKILYEKAYNYIDKVVKALGVNNTLLHADLIYTDNMDVFLIELSPRPSGANLHNNFTILSTDIDMVTEYINFSINKKLKLPHIPRKVKNTLISYFNFERCTIVSIPSQEYLLKKYPLLDYSCNIQIRDKMQVIKDSSVHVPRGYYILYADSAEKLKILRENLLNEFEVTNE